MTWRGAVLLLAPLPLVGAGAAVPALFAIGLVLMLLFGVAIAVDSRRAPGAGRLQVRRTHDEILSVGAANRITVRVDCRGRRAAAVLRDETPLSLHPSQTVWRLTATELIPERAQPLVVCLDHGRLMGVGAGELTKLDHAVNAALLLVHVALRSGDRAGMLGFADHVTASLVPRAGAAQLRRFLDTVRPLFPGETE